MSVSIHPPYPYKNVFFLTYPFPTLPTSPLQPLLLRPPTPPSSPQHYISISISIPTLQPDSHLESTRPTTPIPSPPSSSPITQAISTSVTSPLPFDPVSAITGLQTSVQSLIDAQTVTHQRLEQHSLLIQQQNDTITRLEEAREQDRKNLERMFETIKQMLLRK